MSEGAGLFVSLKRALATLVGIIGTRLELLANEWQEERLRLVRMLMLALLTVFFLCMGSVLLTLFVVAAWWHDHPLLAISGLAALFILAAVTTGSMLMRLLRQPPVIFSSSLVELRRDRRELGGDDG